MSFEDAVTRFSFSVVDSLAAPHGGRLLRLQLVSGTPPRLGQLKDMEMVATSPAGRICRFRIRDFAVLGGKVRQARFKREGKIDVRVREIDDRGPIGLRWVVRPASRRELSRQR